MTTREYRVKGDEKNKSGDHKGAIADYTKSIEVDSSNFLAYYGRGSAKSTIKDYQGAIVDYTKVIEIDPKAEMAYFKRGYAKIELKNYRGAIADCTKTIEINPNCANSYNNRGFAKIYLKDYKGALADCTKAIEIDPDFAEAYESRGYAKIYLKNYNGAIDDYTKAVEIDPNYTIAYDNRGFAKIYLKDYKGAIDDYTKVIEIDPNYANAYCSRGFEKAMQQEYKEAIADSTKAIELNPKDALAYWNRGIAKIGLKDHQGVFADYTKAIEIDPNYAEICSNKGNAKDNIQDRTISERYWFFYTCSEIDKLGSRPEDESKIEDYANQIIRICDEFDKNAARFYVYIHDILCDAFILKKEYSRAIQELDNITVELIEDNSNLWKFYTKKADLYIKLGNIKEAIDNYKKAYHYCDDNVDKIGVNKKLQRLIDGYNNQFVELPYTQRKWVVVDDDKTATSDVFVVLDKKNLPSNVKFPLGHPLKEELYIGHPFIKDIYMPYLNYEVTLFRDKFEEFSYFIQCLGAKAMTIKVAKGSESSLANIISFLSHGDNQKSIEGSVGFKGFGVNGNKKDGDTYDKSNNNSQGMREDAQTAYSRTQIFNPTKKPYLPSDLIWLANEPSWQRLYQQRTTGNILHHHDVLSSKSSYSISEKEETSLKEAFKTFIGGDIGFKMVNIGGGKTTERNNNIEELVEKTFSQSESIQWEIEIEFESIENLTEDLIRSEATIVISEALSDVEDEYIEEVKFMLEDDGIIDEKERSILERFRERKGISKDRAAELENRLFSIGDLNENEKEYLEEYQELLNDGEITEKERKILNRMANRLAISEERANQLEGVKKTGKY
ncbi:tetratricopeptide repeat protein [Flavobacterium sp. GNP002]